MAHGPFTTMKLRTLVQSNPSRLLSHIILLIFCSHLSYLGAQGQQYSLVAASGRDIRIFDHNFHEVLYYQGDLKQLTINFFSGSQDIPQNSRIIQAELPFAWRMTANGKYLFGLDPQAGQGIVRISLLDSENRTLTILPPNTKLLQVINENLWLTLRNTQGLYTISLLDIDSNTSRDIYSSRTPISQAFYNTSTMNLFIFSFEQNSEYTDIARQFYRLKRLDIFSIYNTRTKRKTTLRGGYATLNALKNQIIYFQNGQGMLANAEGGKPTPLPLTFSPLYTIIGEWQSAPHVVMLPDKTFILWLKNQDGFWQLLHYDKDGQPINILLNQQNGPVSLQLIAKLPAAFLSGENG